MGLFFLLKCVYLVASANRSRLAITASMWVPFVKHFLGYIFDAQNYCIAFPPCKS
jgi:hypothetical protein